jgi:hypothetical protein
VLWASGTSDTGVIWDVIHVEMGFGFFEIRYAFGDDTGSLSGAAELKVAFATKSG